MPTRAYEVVSSLWVNQFATRLMWHHSRCNLVLFNRRLLAPAIFGGDVALNMRLFAVERDCLEWQRNVSAAASIDSEYGL
jgi:hypothetical protein